MNIQSAYTVLGVNSMASAVPQAHSHNSSFAGGSAETQEVH